MEYIVYQTTNLVNNKIYIGVHKTENHNVFDGYYGCGCSLKSPYLVNNPHTPFQRAIKKYGFENFRRTVIAVFSTLEEALQLEAVLVNKDFVAREDTYNIALGGNMGVTNHKINQFDKDGKLIKTWINMKEASEALGVSHTSINNAKLFKSSCLGYFWSEYDTINPSEFSYHVGTRTYKYTVKGELVAQFESMTEACKEANTKEKTLYRAIKANIMVNNFYYSFELVKKFRPKIISIKHKTFYIYDLDGNFIKELHSGKEIKEFYNIGSYGVFKEAILNNRPYKNTQISLNKVDKMNKAVTSNNIPKKVGRYSLNDELLQEYSSIKEASREYGSGVFRVINGRQESTKGFKFKLI